ncbi:MAG: molybdopterin-dependent oxidoreductase [Desulfitobacterium hafniense]|nr:molybdopterin-dependent oxidoreductase [Desulfitobacterium hafniense]
MGFYIRPQVLSHNSKPMAHHGDMRTSICSLCNGGCGLKVSVDQSAKVQAVFGDPDNPYNKGKLCPKPMEIVQTLYGPDRVGYPLKKVNGQFVRISWDEALNIIAQKHLNYLNNDGSGSIVGFTSKIGGSYSKLALSIFSELTGMANFGTGPICYDSEEKVRKAMFGSGSASTPLSDAIFAKLILIIGNNCAQTKAGQFQWLQEARRAGAKVVVIDPRYTETAQQVDQFIQIKPGTDGALGMALLHLIIKNKQYDEEFVREKTKDFDQLAKAVADFTPEKAAQITGVPQEVIEKLARDLGTSRPAMLWPGRGIVCVNNAGSTLLAFEALMAILGNIGKPGSGIVSHINGYGKANNLVPPEAVVKPHRKRNAQELYQALEEGEIKMLYIAGNPCANWPDSNRMSKGIAGVDFVVCHTLVLDDSAMLADIVLPAVHWLEESGMQAGINRVMQWKEKTGEPYAEAKSGGDFFRQLASKMGLPVSCFPDNPEEAWELERTHNPAIVGITVERMRQTPGGVHYPCPENGEESVRLFANAVFPTASGKIELLGDKRVELKYSDPLEAPGNAGMLQTEYPYLFSTVKVAAHYHTECQYSEWARELEKPYVELHPLTAVELEVTDGEELRIETATGSLVLPVRITHTVPRNVLFTQPYYTMKSGYETLPVNSLFPVACDQAGGNFVNKNILCRAYAERRLGR